MPKQELWSVVQDMAIAAATQDSRFLPITADELDKIHIEISVLTPLQKITLLTNYKSEETEFTLNKAYTAEHYCHRWQPKITGINCNL